MAADCIQAYCHLPQAALGYQRFFIMPNGVVVGPTPFALSTAPFAYIHLPTWLSSMVQPVVTS